MKSVCHFFNKCVKMNSIGLLFVIFAGVFHRTSSQTGTCTKESVTVYPEADVKFSVILTVRESTDGQTCGSVISERALRYLAVVEWAVNKFNGNSVIKLGFDVHDDCGLPWKSIGHAVDILDGPVLGTDACVTAVDTACQIGIMGTSQSNTMEAILYTIANMSLPVISPYVTTEGLPRHKHFYRTASRDDLHIQAILSTLRVLDMNYIAVVRADDLFSQYAAARLGELGREYSICIDTVTVVKTGEDLNRTALTSVREHAKNKQIRILYIGTRTIAMKMFEQLNGFHKAEMSNISWLLSFHPSEDAGSYTTSGLNNKTILITPSFVHLPEAEAYVESKWRTAFLNENVNVTNTDALHDLMVCSGRTSVPPWSDQHVLSTIDAVLSFGYALQRQTLLHGCDTSQEPVCGDLKSRFRLDIDTQPLVYNDTSVVNITELVQLNRSIMFRSEGEIDQGNTTPLYDVSVTTQTSPIKIGEFRNLIFNVDASADSMIDSIGPSTCSIKCETCLDLPEIEYIYIPGDTLLLGIFSVHETDPNNPFQCGEFRLSQLDAVIIESFIHTLEITRNETAIKFGALILDDCYSSPRTELVLTQVMSGKVKLSIPNSDDYVDVTKIAAVVSALGSTVTKSVTSLMNTLNIPVVTASASSKDLDDRINYPYFLRTVPSDEEQVRAMISIIENMSWQYVSLLFVENNYGQKAMESIVHLANTSGICIANTPEGISQVGLEDSVTDLNVIHTKLANQKSNVVVYFGTERRIYDFLTELNGDNDYIFLASEDWGDRSYMLDLGGDAARGSITLKNEVDPLIDDSFADFLRTLNPITTARNPWFTEYWETLFQCDLPQSFHFKYSKPCDESDRLTEETIIDLLTDQRIVHTVDSVTAVTKGLQRSKDKHCGFENSFPCDNYFDYVPEVVKFIREVTIDRGGAQRRVFKDDGNGKIGFTINNVQEVDGHLEYVQVGKFDEGILNLDKSKLKFGGRQVDGQCFSTQCDHCLERNSSVPVVETTTHGHPIEKEFSVPDYTIIGILGFLCLLMVIFGIIIICYFRRRVKELEAQLKKTCYEMKTGYLTTTYRAPDRRKENGSLTYPDMQFSGTPSGTADDTLYDWRKAQYQLAGGGSPNSYVNKGFAGSEIYLSSRQQSSDENQNYPNGSPSRHVTSPAITDHSSSGDRSDGPPYVPSSSTSYGVTSHSSFKRPSDQQPHVKKQPRTQLAVPPCRPELPPRDNHSNAHAPKPDMFPDSLDNMPAAVPKDKHRNRRGSPKRTVSPPSFKTSPTGIIPPYSLDKPDSPRYKGLPTGNGIHHEGLLKDQRDLVNVGGSLEKISRV